MSEPTQSNPPGFHDLANRSNLTNSQLLIWLGQQLNPGSPLYNMAMRFDIDAAIDVDAFRAAVGEVVGDSDSMRSVVEVIDQTPHQKTLDNEVDHLEFFDLSTDSEKVQRCDQEIDRRTAQLFDLSKCNFYTVLIKLDPTHHVWFFNQHHLFTDIKSIELIFKQVSKRYFAHISSSTPEGNSVASKLPQFASYRESEQRYQQHTENLTNHAPTDIIPLYHRKQQSRQTLAFRVETVLAATYADQLRQLANRPGFATLSPELSIFNLLTTAFCAYLHRVSDAEQISLGCPVHNRATIELKNTIGLLIEVYPLSLVVDPEDSFRSLHEKVTNAAFQHLKFAANSRSGVDAARGYNIVVNYITAEFTEFGPHACRTSWLHNNHIDPQHDLRLQVMDLAGKGELKLCFDINQALMDQSQGASALSHFVNVLDSLLSDPDGKIETAVLAGESEKEELIKELASLPVPSTDSGNRFEQGTILRQFKHQVDESPDAIAAIDGTDQICYSDLDQLSDELAGRILQQYGDRKLIGICAARSFGLLIAILAIQKSGAAFVPLDPVYPDNRLRKICENAELQLVLCDTTQQMRLADVCELVMDISQPDEDNTMTDQIALPEVQPEDAAYIIFTSGSTGEPKGVVVQHGALGDYVTWAAQTYCRERNGAAVTDSTKRESVFPLYSSIGFDLTITSVFVPLTLGGCIRIYPDQDGGMRLSIMNVMQEDAVDVIKLTPAHLSLMGKLDLHNSKAHTLILGGEDLTTAVAQQALKMFRPDVRIFNEYGPTEAVVGCMVHQYRPEIDKAASVPIGRPADGVNIYLLDAGGNPVPEGVTGEIWIGGRRLAAGYLNQPELTRERFRTDPFFTAGKMYKTGDLGRMDPYKRLMFLGRNDTQVKIRGVRIELAEIAQAMKSHPLVGDCHISVLQQSNRNDIQPVHYCVICGLASNYPGVSFDHHGKCNHCHDFDSYRDLATGYFRSTQELQALLTERSNSKRGQYDLMMLLSGGKDSTYALYQICKMGLSVFALTLDNGYISEGAKANIRRSVADLGIGHQFITTDAMNVIFADSLDKHSSVCFGCFKTIYTLAINHAHQLGIPVIVTGLSRGQMFETRLTKQVFEQSAFDPEAIDREVLETRKVYHRIPDKVTECIDMSLFATDNIFDEIQFVDFYRYCDVSMEDMY
ncbi:MAG: amino acid adenylation domain-containing protein, partial [bacterium]